MDFDLGTWHNLMYVIGEVTVIFILGVLLASFVLVVISLYSIKKGHLYLPGSSRQVSSFWKAS